MALKGNLKVAFDATLTGQNGLANPSFMPIINLAMAYADGVAAGQADILYAATRTVASGANDDIDLNGTAIQNALGANIAMLEIVAILIINAPPSGVANTTNLTVGSGTNPVSGWLGGTTPTVGPIRPGGVLLRAETDAAGVCAVVAATGDILRIANSAGAAATYQIAILGRSS